MTPDATIETLEPLLDRAEHLRIMGHKVSITQDAINWLIDNAELDPYTLIDVDGRRAWIAPDHEAIEMAIHDHQMGYGDELPDPSDEGPDEFAHVNDHGNLTLYYKHNGEWVESNSWV